MRLAASMKLDVSDAVREMSGGRGGARSIDITSLAQRVTTGSGIPGF